MGGLVLCTNVNDLAIGIMLMQKGQIVTYESRKLTPGKVNYPSHQKVLLVVIHVLKIWSHYLLRT